MKLYEAIYLPATEQKDPSKKGFKTSEDAWDYASEFFCKKCKKLYDKNTGSPCDAEWMVDEED